MKIYGSPWTASYGMGFYAAFEELAVHFRKIPRDTNIVVTHCPPFGIMDYAHTRCGGFHWGSESLRTRVQKVRPIVHVFGHCVDEQGFYFEDNTLFVNSGAANRCVYFATHMHLMLQRPQIP
jgi:Icc-related predicted phosphoesterase